MHGFSIEDSILASLYDRYEGNGGDIERTSEARTKCGSRLKPPLSSVRMAAK